MELKVGDSLRFKFYNSFFKKEMGFRAGFFYEIQEINVHEPGFNLAYVVKPTIFETYLINGRWFVSDEDNAWYIWDHFYTNQELRLLKLKQLNGTKSR